MPNFTAGTSFTDGVTNDVTAAKLNALVADAVPTSSLSLNSTTGTISLFSSGTGTAASPAIQPTGDTNTGIFFPAADTIAFSEGGAEAMRIDSSGNVGIGISPSQKLDVSGAIAARGTLYLGDGSSSVIRKLNASTPLTFANNGGSAEMTIDSSGNVGIGTNNPSVASGLGLVLNGGASQTRMAFKNTYTGDTSNDGVQFALVAASSSFIFQNRESDGNFAFETAGTERLRIDSSGNVLVGTTSVIGNGKITVQANLGSDNGINIDDSSSSNAAVFARFSIGTGTLCGFISRNAATSAVLYNTSSDYRLKENVQPMIGALAKVSALKPCTWTWKEAGQAGEGFIAHEIQEIVPSAVSGNKDETYPDGTPKHQGMDASYLVATLTAAIQEQQAIITSLTERITALEAA
jgi:hypothetical protein